MKVQVIGREDKDFTIEGNHIVGLRLYVTYESQRAEGTVCEQMFCNINRAEHDALKEHSLPFTMDVDFNRYGKPVAFEIVKK